MHPYKIERSICTYQVCRYVGMYVGTDETPKYQQGKKKEKTKEKERKKKYTRVLRV